MAQSKNMYAGFLGLALAGIVLSGCETPAEVGQVEPVTLDSLDELYEAVDQQLGCPEDSSGDYGFDLGSEMGVLPGRSCAQSIIMAYSDDEEVIADIQDMMSTAQGGTLPVVHNATWLVADITEVAAGNPDLAHPQSRNLETLAIALRANYTEL